MSNSSQDFQSIHDAYRPRILRYLTGLVGEFEAEDLTQEMFVSVHRALSEFRGEAKLETWIYRIATHAAIDRLRQPSFKRESPAVELSGAALEAADSEGDALDIEDGRPWPGEPAALPEQQVFEQEEYDCFCDFLTRLPENYRRVVILDQLGEFTAKEIADLLGLSVDVVKIRLHRGKVWLFKELKAHCNAEDWL